MFLVNYFAVLSKKTYKGTTKNAHTQAKWEIICKKKRKFDWSRVLCPLKYVLLPYIKGSYT